MTPEQMLEYGRGIRAVRHGMRLTLRDVCLGMNIDSCVLGRVESGRAELPKIEQVMDIDIEVTCHRCEKRFNAHPITMDGHLVAFPAYICPECKEVDDANG